MFVKHRLETDRAKALCFHSTRSWLLASFKSGEVIIYDYETGVTLQTYHETDVYIRAVHFHPTRPLFVTGSDDKTVRVYDYEARRCIAVFSDHVDYVRSVQFHPVYPYVISASDDQTIRIWDYEKRVCISVLSGHNHYVMSAFFHPTAPLILSASLDDSVRVWDVSGLFSSNGGGGLFSLTDAVLKFQQEEHVSGVNYAAWHPSRPVAVSCSDDQTVKVWKVNENEMSILATLRSHTDNVSCCVFHPNLDIIVSAGEDCTVRVWDSKRFIHLMKYKSPGDRFWTVAAHESQPIIAAGHDNGIIIFRLQRQRPTFDISGDEIIYYKENSIRQYSINKESDGIVGTTKPRSSGSRASPLDPYPKTFSYNKHQNLLLVGHNEKFELHRLGSSNSEEETRNGRSPVWVSRREFAYLGQSDNQLFVRDSSRNEPKEHQISNSNLIISGPSSGLVYLVGTESVSLYDIGRKTSNKCNISGVRSGYVSPCRKYVAFICQSSVVIAHSDLSKFITYQDGIRVKSGCWTNQLFIFSTKTHVKYLLPNGDSGIIRSLNDRLYICTISNNTLVCLNTKCEVQKLAIDRCEGMFKYNLWKGDVDAAVEILRSAKLCSDSIIDYMQSKGYPELALIFVKDPSSRFRLGIESGDLDVALSAADELNNSDVWDKLGEEAVWHGKFSVAETAYQKSGNEEKLMFLYLISGQIDKMQTMEASPALELQRNIALNDFSAISTQLSETSPCLSTAAAINASLHNQGSKNVEGELAEKLKDFVIGDIRPAQHVNKDQQDWPLLYAARKKILGEAQPEDSDDAEGWGIEDDSESDNAAQVSDEEKSDEGWDVEIEFDGDSDTPVFETKDKSVCPARGVSIEDEWKLSDISGELAAAGRFGDALQALKDQICIKDASSLRTSFIEMYMMSHACVELGGCGPLSSIPLSSQVNGITVPDCVTGTGRCKDLIKNGLNMTTKGKFSDAVVFFSDALKRLCLSVCNTQEEQKDVSDSITLCRNYIQGLGYELKRAKIQDTDPEKALELSCLFAKCDLMGKHHLLALKSVCTRAFKAKQYAITEFFANAFVRESSTSKDREWGSQLLDKVVKLQRAGGNTKPAFDPKRMSNVVCASTMTPIPHGSSKVSCPYCSASYLPEYKGQVCSVCEISEIGGKGLGLSLLRKTKE